MSKVLHLLVGLIALAATSAALYNILVLLGWFIYRLVPSIFRTPPDEFGIGLSGMLVMVVAAVIIWGVARIASDLGAWIMRKF